MSKPKILRQNYIDSSILVAQTKSSEVAAAPATNVQALTRRTKVWRTAGYWNITASNNVIKFRDIALGTVKTATIAVAEYTTDALFLAAVDAALEAAGSADYTVTRDTATNKIKLTSNGAAFQLVLSDVGFTAKNTLGFTTGSDLTGFLTYTADTLKIHTNEWIRWDLGTGSMPGAFVLIGKRNEGIQLTSSAVVTLIGNSTDTTTSPQYSQVLDWNEDAIAIIDADGLYQASGLRYWWLDIQDASNPDGYIEVSNVYLGEAYETTQGSINFPFETELVDGSRTDYSEAGNAFTNVVQITEEMDIRWFALNVAEKEYLEEFISIYQMAYPFFISLDPDAVFSSSSGKWIKYCRFVSVPKFTLEQPNLYSATWTLREEL